jgi:hypothetical protein
MRATPSGERILATLTDTPTVLDSPGRQNSFNWAITAAVVAIVAVGIALRAVQYSANTSLWLDEIALVKGILGSDLWSLLLRPLPFDQVAPKGFLFVQKLAVTMFGPNDYALRLFPFLCSAAAVIVFGRLAQRALPPTGAIAATILFAAGAPFIAFAGIVKQYATDVVVAVALTWLALELVTRPVTERKAWRVAIAGGLLLWFSQPGVIVVAALAPLAMWWISTDAPGSRQRVVSVVMAMWGASAIAVTMLSSGTMSEATRNYMHVYWTDGFPPDSFTRAIELGWPWPNIRLLFGGGPGVQAGLGFPLAPLYPVLAGVGFIALWVQRRRVAIVLAAPVILTLGAAIAQQYPFSDRLILFLVPSLLLAMAATIDVVYGALGKFSTSVGALAAIGLTFPAITPVLTSRPPYRVEDVKSLLAQIQAKRQPGDATYVYYGAAPVMSVYASTVGFQPGEYVIGGCHRAESRLYLKELDTFRGTHRIWIVLTHSLATYREREDIVAYLDAIGTRLDEMRVVSHAMGRTPAPAEAFLYDLSATPRLVDIDSDSFKLTGTSVLNPRIGCINGPEAMIPSDFQCSGPPNTRCTRRPNVGW